MEKKETQEENPRKKVGKIGKRGRKIGRRREKSGRR